MKSKLTALITLVLCPAIAQYTPPTPDRVTVTTDATGELVSPSNLPEWDFWGTNSIVRGWADLPYTFLGETPGSVSGIYFRQSSSLHISILAGDSLIYFFNGTWGGELYFPPNEGDDDVRWTLPLKSGTVALTTDIPDPLYPVFTLTVPYGAPWTDFELKGSRTNFEGSPNLVYYFHSPGSTTGEVGDLPKVWYTDSGKSPRIAWWELNMDPRVSIFDSLEDINSEVGGIIIVITDPEIIDSFDDPTLVWTYSWLDGTTTDDDAANRSIWRPILPVWSPVIPNP